MRRLIRSTRLIIHVLAAVFYCGIIYHFINKAAQKRYIQKWSRQLMAISGIKTVINYPERLSSQALIVSNHISWLDIFLIYAHINGHFIAKSAMATWPVIGYLGRKVGTIYLDRLSNRNLKQTLNKLIENLLAHERCIFFPEGTTASQGKMLPFHANLFEGAIHTHIPVQPLAIRYRMPDGSYAKAVDFTGNISMLASLKRILNASHITAELTVLPIIDITGKHRKDLAQMAFNAIELALKNDNTR